MKKTDPPVVVEHILNAKIEDVWKIITEIEHMSKWFFDNIPSFEAVVGFETRFTVSTGERSFPHIWKITEVDTGKKITYNWKYEGYEGDSSVHFELFLKDDKTLIRLTTEILEDFTLDIPEFKRESCVGGWNYFIKDNLPKYLDSISR